MLLLHDGKTDEWTRRQAAWGLNWAKYKSGGDALHGRITTAWHKKSHRQFPASQRQKWIRSEPRYIHTHAHTLRSSIVGYHFVCISTNVVYWQLLGELNVLPLLFLESLKTWLHSPTPSSLGLFNKNVHTHIMVQNSKSARFQTPLESLEQLLWVSLINFTICCISFEQGHYSCASQPVTSI